MGGYKDVPQQYCGVVGGQSTHFAEIDTEIKVRFFSLAGKQQLIVSKVDLPKKSHPCPSRFVGVLRLACSTSRLIIHTSKTNRSANLFAVRFTQSRAVLF